MDQQGNQNQQQEQKTSYAKAAGAFIWDLVKILIIALVIIVPFRMFIAEPFVVSGSSMVPTFHNGDYLIVDRLSYLTGSPKRGDVIVLLYPKDTSQFFIKRIIGLPGDTVTIEQGYVEISNAQNPNGFRLNEPYLVSQTETFGSPTPVHLDSDSYFVLGDNRTASSDSRVWGILPKDDIVGRVWVRIYPFSTAKFFQTPTYSN